MVTNGAAEFTTETFPLTIDYTESLAEIVTAGTYDYVSPDITEEHFPTAEGVAKIEAVLVHFDRVVTSDDVLHALEHLDLRPGTVFELAAFGEQRPDLQCQFPIIALGFVWAAPDCGRRVVYLWEKPEYRELSLIWYDDDWPAPCRFLAFRK